MPAETQTPDTVRPEIVREAVASFATKAQFRDAATRLLAAGFRPDDLSVLASHDSLEVAGDVPGYPSKPEESLTAGLTDEVNYIWPMTDTGIVLLSGGPVSVALAAFVAAGLGGTAVKELLDRYTANRHSEEFAAALKAGAVLLWARVGDPQQEATAMGLLEAAGGRHAHIHERPVEPATD